MPTRPWYFTPGVLSSLMLPGSDPYPSPPALALLGCVLSALVLGREGLFGQTVLGRLGSRRG